MSLTNAQKIKIGIIGTGFIASGLSQTIGEYEDWSVSRVLTRRPLQSCRGFPLQGRLTNSVHELIDHADLIVECSGDVLHATDVIAKALEASLPVVTMNSEFHVTTGSYFVDRGILTEAEGDQPGNLAALRDNALAMGFQPLVYGNVKGFYNPNPTFEDMNYWSKKQGISLQTVTAATDGTKIQFEQALVANGFGAEIVQSGLLGLQPDNIEEGTHLLAEEAKRLGTPVSDYLLLPKSDVRIFIVGEHHPRDKKALRYLKMGDGPYYLLKHNTILTYLEIPKTIRRMLDGGLPLLDNSRHPRISVAAVAKRQLSPGEQIERGIGSFDVGGMAVRIVEYPEHLPIGLMANATITRNIEPGQMIRFEDVEIPPSLAAEIWETIQSELVENEKMGKRGSL
ncbi:MAG: NAD(P)-dependent oxidoreductase [Chloroflexi bacterium]|nr:NAD(P)-dependent oxidoreductase [Chloroflexota bacterium]MBU1660936.1 NAD(P)-dependent oxidoreductase [Chloroflexota bacterium]